MRQSATFTLLLAAMLAMATTARAEDEKGFQPIFNGKNLDGWAGKPGWWFVEDGTLTARSTPEKPCRKHNYLMWRAGEATDFELKLEYRIVGGNSGVQFRSRELDDWDIAGYQADIEAGDRWSGCLFEVKGRGGVAMRGEDVVIAADGTKQVKPLGDPAELGRKIKKEDWNRYEIIARGNQITLKINGVLMSRVVDNDRNKVKPGGTIALQMHPGPPMTVQFRNIRLKKLD